MTADPTWTDNFTAVCHVCGETVTYRDGKRVPGPCDHGRGDAA